MSIPVFFNRIRDRVSGLFARRSAVPPPPLRGPDYAKKQGEWGEEKARHFLEKELEPKEKRLRTIGRRVRVGRDEIDLVMEPADPRRRPMVVFVEVKTRTTDAFGGGLAAVDRRKRHALCRAAARYMRGRPAAPFRIDVVEVIGVSDAVPGGAADRILHFENAVPMERRYAVEGLRRRRFRQPRGGAAAVKPVP